MKLSCLVPSVALLSWGFVPVAIAEPNSVEVTEIDPENATASNQSVSSLFSTTLDPSPQPELISDIPRSSEIEHPHTSAHLLVQEPTPSETEPSETEPTEINLPESSQIDEEVESDFPPDETEPSTIEEQDEIEITVTGKRELFPKFSTPVYEITEEEIQQEGANSVSGVLRGLPGFDIAFSDRLTGQFT